MLQSGVPCRHKFRSGVARSARFPNLGKMYEIEFTQFQGTAPMAQAMVAGALDCSTQAPLSLVNGALQGNLEAYIVAQHVSERPGSFSVYWAVKEDSPIKTFADAKGKSVGNNVFGSGILGPMFLLLKKKRASLCREIGRTRAPRRRRNFVLMRHMRNGSDEPFRADSSNRRYL